MLIQQMKQTAIILILQLLMTVSVSAQGHRKFSPEKFDADMEQYVTREASLTPQEAEKFFPLFREMHQKQRAVYRKIRHATKNMPADDKACAATLKECDKLNIELREIEQTYHQKMMKAISAQKVYKSIMAEAKFHRQMMKGWQSPYGNFGWPHANGDKHWGKRH
jgi:hypothetical protein